MGKINAIQRFDTDANLHVGEAADLFIYGTKKLVPWCNKCLKFEGRLCKNILLNCSLRMYTIQFSYYILLHFYLKRSVSFWTTLVLYMLNYFNIL